MGIKDWLGIGQTIAKPIEAVSNLYTTDKARIEAETGYQEVVQKTQLAQIENNKLLITSGKMFNSGWISLLGWTAGFLILCYYLPQILITTYVWGKASIDSQTVQYFPMRSDDLMNLIYLLLGVGAHNLINKKL